MPALLQGKERCSDTCHGLALALLGWTCSEPLRRGLVGSTAAQAGRMLRCTLHLHFLGWEHNLGLKSFNQYPSPSTLTPQQRENR